MTASVISNENEVAKRTASLACMTAMDNKALDGSKTEWIASAQKEMEHKEPDLTIYLIRPHVANPPAPRATMPSPKMV